MYLSPDQLRRCTVAVDLGATRTRIHIKHAGLVVDEPSIVAVNVRLCTSVMPSLKSLVPKTRSTSDVGCDWSVTSNVAASPLTGGTDPGQSIAIVTPSRRMIVASAARLRTSVNRPVIAIAAIVFVQLRKANIVAGQQDDLRQLVHRYEQRQEEAFATVTAGHRRGPTCGRGR